MLTFFIGQNFNFVELRKIFGPDRFNRFDDFLKQKQKERRAKYICRFEK